MALLRWIDRVPGRRRRAARVRAGRRLSDRDDDTGIITITESTGVRMPITVTTTGVIARHQRSGGLESSTSSCTQAAARRYDMRAGSSIAADLGAGNDSFTANGVPVAGQRRRRAGRRHADRRRRRRRARRRRGQRHPQRAAAASTTTSARPATTRSRPATALAERISCGAGSDQARNDFVDIIAECETRRRRRRRRLQLVRRLQRRQSARSSRARARSSRTGSTRTATAATTSTSTATATGSRGPSTATTATPAIRPERARDPRQPRRRELRPARGAVRPARHGGHRTAGWSPAGFDAAARR